MWVEPAEERERSWKKWDEVVRDDLKISSFSKKILDQDL